MLCPKCGKDARSKAAFCNHCGAPMTQTTAHSSMLKTTIADIPAPKPPTAPYEASRIGRNKKKTVLIPFAVIGILAVAVCIGIVIYQNQTAAQRQMINYLERGKYEKAAEYYQKNEDEIKPDKLEPLIHTEVKKIYDSYLKDEKSYHESVDNLQYFYDYPLDATKELLVQVQEKLTLLNDSRSAYLQAVQAEERMDYAEAIGRYRLVIADDPQYDTAQKQIETCYALYIGDVIARVEQYRNQTHYSDALQLLKEASEALGKDKQIDEAMETCITEYKTMLFARAEDYAENGDYEDAAEYLIQYVDAFPDGKDLQEKADQYIDRLMDSLLQEANALISKGDYHNAILAIQTVKKEYPGNNKVEELEENTMNTYLNQQLPLIDAALEASDYLKAYSICKNAMEIMPDYADLLSRMQTIDEKRPILLNELVISQSQFFYEMEKKAEIWRDTIGNEYTYGNLYYAKSAYYDKPYADIYLGSQYQSVSGIIAIGDASSNAFGQLIIYGDGEVLYTGSYSRTTVPQQINLDVSGVTWLKIAVSATNNWNQNLDYLFSDFAFKKLGT